MRRRRTILRDIGRLVTLLAPTFGAWQQNDSCPASGAFVLRHTLAGRRYEVLSARLARDQVAACEAHLMTPSNQVPSEALRSTQKHSEALGNTQKHSEALRSTQKHSEALSGRMRSAPRAAQPCRFDTPWLRAPPPVTLSLPQPPRRLDLA